MTPAVILVGLAGFAYTLRAEIKNQSIRLKSIENELGELRKIVVALARQEERMNAMDQRLLAQGQRIDAQGERITGIDQRTMTNANKIDGLMNREKR